MLRTASFLATAMITNIAAATPVVDGNVIKWTEEGWHQVQLQSTYESVCNGGRQCTVSAGVYTVINHRTGERFPDIIVPGQKSNDSDEPLAPATSTGQVVSYVHGDDGDYQLGLSPVGQRFFDNGDGTFKDKFTGLTWLSVRECLLKFEWSSGVDYANNFSASSGACPSLADGSKPGDWRLPNIKELYTLVHLADSFPTWDPDIPFTGNWTDDPYEFFWSSTSFQPIPEFNAFALDGAVGQIRSYSKSENSFYIWPVRVK